MYLHGGIAMNTREMERMMDQRELRVAECVKTYFNLFGKQPEVKEMANWLGKDYLLDIMRYRRMTAGTGAVCA